MSEAVEVSEAGGEVVEVGKAGGEAGGGSVENEGGWEGGGESGELRLKRTW